MEFFCCSIQNKIFKVEEFKSKKKRIQSTLWLSYYMLIQRKYILSSNNIETKVILSYEGRILPSCHICSGFRLRSIPRYEPHTVVAARTVDESFVLQTTQCNFKAVSKCLWHESVYDRINTAETLYFYFAGVLIRNSPIKVRQQMKSTQHIL